MTSIAERAYEKALKMLKPNPPTTRELLVEIATEQRNIDIDFVRFWLCDHVVGTTLTAHDIKALTKAMEEQSMDKQPLILTLEMDWGEYNTVQCFMDNSTGSVSISNYTEDKLSVIHGLYVDKCCRRTGIATMLLDEADKHADFPITIWIYKDAPEWLRNFYEKPGYQVNEQNNE